MKVRGRWIADANNKILNYCRGEYCFYIQADEVFKKISNDKFKNLFISYPDEIYFNFLHFVFDLETIIKPEKSSYTKAIRIFKKDSYAACHDGFSFQNINSFRPNAHYDKHPIYHISYVYNYKKKIKEHFEKKNGLHINQLSKNKFLNEYVVTQKIDKVVSSNNGYLNHLKQSFDTSKPPTASMGRITSNTKTVRFAQGDFDAYGRNNINPKTGETLVKDVASFDDNIQPYETKSGKSYLATLDLQSNTGSYSMY
jgi:hypothetical protein